MTKWMLFPPSWYDGPLDPPEPNYCSTCGDAYSPYGDGWDGECPSCADRSYINEFPEEE